MKRETTQLDTRVVRNANIDRAHKYKICNTIILCYLQNYNRNLKKKMIFANFCHVVNLYQSQSYSDFDVSPRLVQLFIYFLIINYAN